jgi:4'-phosphopantetheinyl transferase
MSCSYRVPPAGLNPTAGEVHLWLMPLQQAAHDAATLEMLLSAEELRRANAYASAALRGRFVAARAALRAIVGGLLSVPARELPIEYGPHGKPFVRGSRTRFNLSHCETYALLATARDTEVGIDIEEVRTVEDCTDIAERNFCKEEWTELLSVAEELRPRAFMNCWTRTEAYVKAVGHGSVIPLDSFRVSLLPERSPELVAPDPASRWPLYDVSPNVNVAAALVVCGRCDSLQPWTFRSATECVRYWSDAGKAW